MRIGPPFLEGIYLPAFEIEKSPLLSKLHSRACDAAKVHAVSPTLLVIETPFLPPEEIYNYFSSAIRQYRFAAHGRNCLAILLRERGREKTWRGADH